MPLLTATACRDADGSRLALKVVNIANVPITADVVLEGVAGVPEPVAVSVLAGNDLKATNTADQPERLRPVEQQIKLGPRFTHTFPPYSYTVFGPFAVSK